jgi:hypothetical protein
MDGDAWIERLEWSGDGRTGSLLVLPGASGGIFQSPLYWPAVALVDAGWEVLVAQWGPGSPEHEVASTARIGLARLTSSSNVLVMGKSLGSLAAAEVLRANVRSIWLTPLMDRPPVADAIQSGDAATLLIGGTADPTWRRPRPRPGLDFIEVDGANHGLLVGGDWRRSLSGLSAVTERIAAFAGGASQERP